MQAEEMSKRTIHSSMQTVSGKQFNFDDVSSNVFDIKDIAVHLSKICRFNGAVMGRPYSVAQHCVIACGYAPSNLALTMLMHDAAEAYIGDLLRPVKKRMGPSFYDLELAIDYAIAQQFGLAWPQPDVIGNIDLRMLATERRDLLCPTEWKWRDLTGIEPFPAKISTWGWEEAAENFLYAFRECGGQAQRTDVGSGG